MKHLLLEVAEATEVAALAASKYVGSGDKLTIDKVATDAMQRRLNNVSIRAEVVIGEGIKDGSVGLFQGEKVGFNWRFTSELYSQEAEYDIAVDPVDGTTQTAKGGYEAMSVLAMGHKGSLFTTDNFYMNKLAVGKQIAKHIEPSLKKPISETIEVLKKILGRNQITVCMLDRPRHAEMATSLRAAGCRIKFIQDCDVSGAIAAALPESGIDLFLGIGGAPEGVIAAAALKCLGGYFEGQLVDNTTYKPTEDKVYSGEELAKGNVMFAATGITNGSLLKGVRHEGSGLVTNSIIMDSASKSLKRVESYYELGQS